MMPSRCQRVMASHPSKSSTPAVLPIPRTDNLPRASVMPRTPPQQPGSVKTNNSLLLQPVLYSLGERCYGARLNFPSTALSFMHESVEHNSMGSGEGQRQASPQERAPIDRQHLKRRVHTLVKCDASASGSPGRQGRWMDGQEVGLGQPPEEAGR